jgi:hypothetical protein
MDAQHTDRKGRTLAERVAAVHRHGDPVTPEQRAAAEQLLADMLKAAGLHGVTIDDFDWVADLPGACLDVVLAKSRRT